MSNFQAAVITSTLGRDTLVRTLDCVRAQTIPVQHYVFVDGSYFHAKVKPLEALYPEVIFIYLPMNTGGNGMCNSVVNAIAPFLVQEEIICFLDDDNFYKENHIEALVKNIEKYNADYAYNLRYFIDKEDNLICPDNLDSLGFWGMKDIQIEFDIVAKNEKHTFNIIISKDRSFPLLIDTNCYGIKTSVARKLATIWMESGSGNDVNITRHLITNEFTGVCTGERTVFYFYNLFNNETFNYSAFLGNLEQSAEEEQIGRYELMRKINKSFEDLYSGDLLWEKVHLFKAGELIKVTE